MKIFNKKYLFIMMFFLFPISMVGQQNLSFEHFLVEDGLPHNIINQIIQDKKGYIWLATSNGISKYDGYTFKNYKTRPLDKVSMNSNRIDQINEDIYGRIWFKSNDHKTNSYCFNPKTETFWSTDLIKNKEEGFLASQIKINKSGLVWLLSENEGCILVSDSLFRTKVYNKKSKTLNASAVYSVYEDKNKNSWLLTNNGLTLFKEGKLDQPIHHFSIEKGETTSFYTVLEFRDEIWFGGSNGIIEKYSKREDTFKTQKLELDANISWMSKLNEQTVIVLTKKKGFCTINRYTGDIKLYNSKTFKGLKTNEIRPVSVIKDNQLWFLNNNELGINLFDFSTQKIYHYPPLFQGATRSTIPVRAYAFVDYKGDIWVQPYGGGFSKFNQSNHELVPLNYHGYFPNGNFTNSFHTALFDKQGNLWYNTQSEGLVKVVFSENNFKSSRINDELVHSKTKEVRSLLQDNNGNIWVGNKQNQVVILDKKLQKIGEISLSGQLKENSKWNKAAYTITQDNQSNIWIGTRGDGLFKFIPQEKPFTYKVVNFKTDELNPYSISSDHIYDVFQDKDNRIWVATFYGGLNLIDSDIDGETRFINYNNKWNSSVLESFKKIRCINQTSEGVICVGSTNGLFVFDPKSILSDVPKIKTYENGFDDTHNALSGNDIIDICITKEQDIFIATTSSGFSKVIKKDSLDFPTAFKSYTKKNGLQSDNILSLLEDMDGNIWIATDYSLSRFNPEHDFFEIFNEVKKVISDYNLSEATKLKLNSGELLFGYSEGILHFFSDQIKTNDFSPYLALSDFQIFNKKVSINKDSPLSVSIDNCKELQLSHDQNFFNIEFAALDYQNHANVKYVYKLEGFDKDWNHIQSNRIATYTNVPKGSYVFKVKSTNSQGIWVDNERQLPIIIKPSIWNTNFFYFIYALAFIAFILIINYIVLTIYRLKSNVKLEKQMSDMKQNFFTDISHELRTPITLISSPIEYLINDHRTPESIKKQLSYIAHSADRLQRLVNQILDFRKIEDTSIKVSEINVSLFVEHIFNDFKELAKEKEIDFNFYNYAEGTKIWADRDGLEKILMNLLSNAFKFTPKGKSINVEVVKNEKQLGIHVADFGIGISKEHQGKLFNRFVSFNTKSNNPSTGIGLSMVKEIADKHQAKISFNSEIGKGTTFSVYFKLGKEHYANDVEFIKEAENKTEIKLDINSNKILSSRKNSEKTRILIVEDDPKLRSFIKTILEDKYIVIEAEDGEVGYDLIVKEAPDFIVSDIMMPKLNGIDLLKKIRNNINISHIPVILLTAKSDIESKIEGLSYGADDYIIKPFSVSYFMVKIENLLSQRKRLQNVYSSFDVNDSVSALSKPNLITSQDEEIMKKMMEIILENIDNNSFSVEELSTKVGLNRTTFGNKVKSLTGFTPVEFIRDVRIKKAAQLIVKSKLLIKEVAFMTGFSDMKYFSKSFKKKYGVSPMEYRKQNK